MKDEVYHKLGRALDSLANSFPATQSGVEILLLKKLFTDEEASLAAKLTGSPETFAEISERTGVSTERTKLLLEAMVKKGLVWCSGKGQEPKFRLAPYIVGIFESQLNGMDHELAHLFERYWMEGGGKGIMRYGPDTHRVDPAHGALMKTEVVLPYNDVRKMLISAKSFRARDCICRKIQEYHDERCSYPLHNCITFFPNEMPADATTITKEQALKILDEAEKLGMVHCVANQQSGFFWLCNCCGCCCGILRGINLFGVDRSGVRSNYLATLDEEKCTACGTCQERCHVGAISVDATAVIDRDKCIGCGVCVTGCPTEALSLKLRPDSEIITPPLDFKDWETTRLENRGLITRSKQNKREKA